MTRRYYSRKPVTQVDVSAAAAKIQSELTGMNLTVRPNGYGYRIQCDRCGWSACHGPVQGAIEHAATH
jgi:hypothetical protein